MVYRFTRVLSAHDGAIVRWDLSCYAHYKRLTQPHTNHQWTTAARQVEVDGAVRSWPRALSAAPCHRHRVVPRLYTHIITHAALGLSAWRRARLSQPHTRRSA